MVAADVEKGKPERLFLRLNETDTIWFLSITSKYSQEDAEDASRVSKENDAYREVRRLNNKLV